YDRRGDPARAGRRRLALDAVGMAVRVRLRLSAVFRFLGLQRYGGRTGTTVRPAAAAELRLAVSGARPVGLLAPLAYFAVVDPARLPLHPAGRKPRIARGDGSERDDHDAPRRTLAWGELDVRRVGGVSRAASPASSLRPPVVGTNGPGDPANDDFPARHAGMGAVPIRRLGHVRNVAVSDVPLVSGAADAGSSRTLDRRRH